MTKPPKPPLCPKHKLPLICLACQGERARQRAVEKKGPKWRKARAKKAARARWDAVKAKQKD